MAGEYEIDAGGNRGSLLTVILGNVLWTLKLQEFVNQGVLWNVFASVFSRLSELTCHFNQASVRVPRPTVERHPDMVAAIHWDLSRIH